MSFLIAVAGTIVDDFPRDPSARAQPSCRGHLMSGDIQGDAGRALAAEAFSCDQPGGGASLLHRLEYNREELLHKCFLHKCFVLAEITAGGGARSLHDAEGLAADRRSTDDESVSAAVMDPNPASDSLGHVHISAHASID